jgi:hypothetical protein
MRVSFVAASSLLMLGVTQAKVFARFSAGGSSRSGHSHRCS